MVLPRLFAAFVLFAGTGAAMAHGGHGGAGFAAGIAHPFSGVDHVMAMLAVGLFAARHSGLARWVLPSGFVLTMAGGALLGAAGFVVPFQEAGIAASLLVLGLVVAAASRAPLAASIPLAVAFGLFHGGAHFAEMGGGTLLTYTAGFAAATMALQLAGIGLGRWAPETRTMRVLRRLAGGVVAATGMVLLGV